MMNFDRVGLIIFDIVVVVLVIFNSILVSVGVMFRGFIKNFDLEKLFRFIFSVIIIIVVVWFVFLM